MNKKVSNLARELPESIVKALGDIVMEYADVDMPASECFKQFLIDCGVDEDNAYDVGHELGTMCEWLTYTGRV